MSILNEVKESLKLDMQKIFNTELVVMHNPISFYDSVIYCVLNSVNCIKHKNCYKFKLQGSVKVSKQSENVDLGMLTELVLLNNSKLALNNGKITFLSEVISGNICCIDFVFVSNSYSYNKANVAVGNKSKTVGRGV